MNSGLTFFFILVLALVVSACAASPVRAMEDDEGQGYISWWNGS